MNEPFDLKRVKLALRMYEDCIRIHEYYFPKHEKWSKPFREMIEGFRISNKCKSLILHDRALTNDKRGAK